MQEEVLTPKEWENVLKQVNQEFDSCDADVAKIKRLMRQLFPYFKVIKQILFSNHDFH